MTSNSKWNYTNCFTTLLWCKVYSKWNIFKMVTDRSVSNAPCHLKIKIIVNICIMSKSFEHKHELN